MTQPTTFSAGLGYLTSIHLYLLLWIEKFNEPRARRSEKSSSLWPDIMGVTLHLCQSLRGEWGAFNLRATHKRKPGTPLPYRMLEVAERNLSLCGWEKKYGSLLSNFLSSEGLSNTFEIHSRVGAKFNIRFSLEIIRIPRWHNRAHVMIYSHPRNNHILKQLT